MTNGGLVIIASLFGIFCTLFFYDTWKLSQQKPQRHLALPEPKQQLQIMRLSSFENVSVSINPIRIFHFDPQILVDEVQFSHTLRGNGFLLHESESVVVSFRSYQVVNMIRIIIRVTWNQIDDQTKKILVYGIYRNNDYLLMDIKIMIENSDIKILRSSASANYQKIFLLCTAPLCKNQYNSIRLQFQGSNETVQIYPIALYYVNDLEQLDDLILLNK